MWIRALFLAFAAACFVPSLEAQETGPIESVTKSGGQLVILQSGKRSPLTADTSLPFGVIVSTNGTFTVEKGKPRELLEGQVIRSDGNLLNPDGTLMPVFDHLAMKLGKIVVVVDGQSEALAAPKPMADGSTLYPDGTQVLPEGRRLKLVDGQLLKPDGSWLPIKDTVTLKDGKVYVQKDGALLALKAFQVMGMSDGTKVQGDGTVTRFGGQVIKLDESQTILVDGVAVKR